MAKQGDGLFLLEVLVDKVIFNKSPCFSDRDFRTCVNIQCPAVDPLEICDDDPSAIAKSSSPYIKTFNSGKSCLFSLKESDISSAMSKFPIKVTIYKSLPCGCIPTKIIMGECTIDMTKEFIEARNKFLENPNNVSYQALKDSFRLSGPDGTETGEILMFLRISCFGRLIVTQFQGTGPPSMTPGAGSSTIVDRSCNPRKDFQSLQDPCACGAARGHSSGARMVDQYNTKPCDDADDPCFCSGPMAQKTQQMACRNTDPYCLHVPQDCCPTGNKVVFQIPTGFCEVGHKQRAHFNFSSDGVGDISRDEPGQLMPTTADNYPGCLPRMPPYRELGENFKNELKTTTNSCLKSGSSAKLFTNELTFHSEKLYKSSGLIYQKNNIDTKLGLFGQEIMAYMTFLQNDFKYLTSGTQATASINKCFQVYENSNINAFTSDSNDCSTCTISTCCNSMRNIPDRNRYSEVYFFGTKKGKSKGMGPTSVSKTNKPTTTGITMNDSKTNTSRTSSQDTLTATTNKKSIKDLGKNVGTRTSKVVSINDQKPRKSCPAKAAIKDDMMATISHIRIGPREFCPAHGKEPCQGPKCVLASSGDEQAQVKVTTASNPRRGVFELVIRRMTGAPLARNELMLEWTPPPSQPLPCTTVCPVTYMPPKRCRTTKCKMVVCRPSSSKIKKLKRCISPCYALSCKRCCKTSCSRKSCRPPRLRSPVCCRSRSSSPCKIPCTPIKCTTCCNSFPCNRPCPVGRKRPRKVKSRPKIKSHKIRTSPCLNRSKTCPVVKCRSVPGLCVGSCDVKPTIYRSALFCKPARCCKTPCLLHCD